MPQYNMIHLQVYKVYDKFLIAYNGGENSAFWTDIKTKRRQNGFE